MRAYRRLADHITARKGCVYQSSQNIDDGPQSCLADTYCTSADSFYALPGSSRTESMQSSEVGYNEQLPIASAVRTLRWAYSTAAAFSESVGMMEPLSTLADPALGSPTALSAHTKHQDGITLHILHHAGSPSPFASTGHDRSNASCQ